MYGCSVGYLKCVEKRSGEGGMPVFMLLLTGNGGK